MAETLPRHVIRTGALKAEEAMHVRHPLNPQSDVTIHALSRRAGMKRAHLSLGRIPPGKESFIPHAHAQQEEFIFILEGEATVTIGDSRIVLGSGDFVGFPTDGVVHHLANTGTRDLVYLMGGEHTEIEVSRFPTIGKVGLFDMGVGRVTFFDEASAETKSIEEWANPKK
jgi:uncharacterized cupin superfamily protein